MASPVLAIIALIMGIVGPRVVGYLSSSKVKVAHLQIKSLSSALDLYYLDVGHYPSTTDGLQALIEKPKAETHWDGPYLKDGKLPDDPWGHPYIYHIPGEVRVYDIMSLGASGQEEGATLIKDQP